MLQASLVPHLHTPLVQVSDVPLQAATVEEHLQTLFVASQTAPDACPAQLLAVPHIQLPETHVSPEMVHADTEDEHLHTLFEASQ